MWGRFLPTSKGGGHKLYHKFPGMWHTLRASDLETKSQLSWTEGRQVTNRQTNRLSNSITKSQHSQEEPHRARWKLCLVLFPFTRHVMVRDPECPDPRNRIFLILYVLRYDLAIAIARERERFGWTRSVT